MGIRVNIYRRSLLSMGCLFRPSEPSTRRHVRRLATQVSASPRPALPVDRAALLARPLLLTDPWVSNYNLKLGVPRNADKSFGHKVLCDGGVSREGVCPCA